MRLTRMLTLNENIYFRLPRNAATFFLLSFSYLTLTHRVKRMPKQNAPSTDRCVRLCSGNFWGEWGIETVHVCKRCNAREERSVQLSYTRKTCVITFLLSTKTPYTISDTTWRVIPVVCSVVLLLSMIVCVICMHMCCMNYSFSVTPHR